MSIMIVDNHGQIILTETELCGLYFKNPTANIKKCILDTDVAIHQDLDLSNIPELVKWVQDGRTTAEFDREQQANWNMPDEYKNMDIAAWVLAQCSEEIELQRVGTELLMYLDRDLFPLLQYLKYLVDTMRKYNIVWGVGRGSSVSSYVLFLIGIHRINSIHYELDINDFLR